jgi:hypothetical protein
MKDPCVTSCGLTRMTGVDGESAREVPGTRLDRISARRSVSPLDGEFVDSWGYLVLT